MLGGTRTDVQFTVELKEDDFDVWVSGGPIHEKEVGRYLGFDSKHSRKQGCSST